MTRPNTFPEAMRWVAEYIEECHRIIGEMLARSGRPQQDRDFAAGKTAQDDLIRMAKLIEGNPDIAPVVKVMWDSIPAARGDT